MKSILILAVMVAACAPAASARDPASGRGPHWASIVHTLDERRERAYVRGDPSLLDRVYVAGSAVRRRDAHLVRAYERRGLELDAVPMHLRDVDVVSRRAGRVRLRVVDRLGTIRVHRAGGPWRTLPADRPTEHIVTLTRGDGGWRIAAIRRVAG